MSLHPTITFTRYRGHAVETAPAVEPLTADELRAYLVETEAALPDSEANDYIKEARNLIEEMTGLALITQELRMALDAWPYLRGEWWSGVREGSIAEMHGKPAQVILPRYPLQAIDSVTVYDTDGTGTAVTVASVFDVDTYQKPGRMALKSGATWPVAMREINAIEIVYTAGFGDAATAVPPVVKRAVKQIAAYLYAHKGDDCGADDALAAAGSLLDAYRVKRL
jgi:hypothetical protein